MTGWRKRAWCGSSQGRVEPYCHWTQLIEEEHEVGINP